jgi:hypothetical protein
VEWVVREGVGAGGEMTQALYAHMNNKIIKKRRCIWLIYSLYKNEYRIFKPVEATIRRGLR